MIPDWLDAIEREVTECLCAHGGLSPRELAERLGISEAGAVSYICLLASTGRLIIERVSPARVAGPSLPRREERRPRQRRQGDVYGIPPRAAVA
jgi:hypothetical protein